jgi:hypothetical protein
MYAPVALFVYNRPGHTRQTIEALRKNTCAEETDLYIFSDAPKNSNHESAVKEVRAYLKTIKGFRTIQIVERSENMGLSASIISGVTEIVNKYGKIIVLEDDLVTSPFFLKYMNDGLNIYEKDDQVISIHGYIYPIKDSLPETFFILGADCWGWATWKRGWDIFEKDGKKLMDELKSRNLSSLFDFNDSYPYTKMLEDQIAGKVESWAIRWYASAFLKNKLTLYPGSSLVENIGFDGSGEHGAPEAKFLVDNKKRVFDLKRIPVSHNEEAFMAMARFFKPPKVERNKLKVMFKRLLGIK